MYIESDNGFYESEKLIKALPSPTMFTNGKDPSIDQQLSKMQVKIEIN